MAAAARESCARRRARGPRAAGGGAPPGGRAELREAALTASWRERRAAKETREKNKKGKGKKNKFQKVVLSFGVRGQKLNQEKPLFHKK